MRSLLHWYVKWSWLWQRWQNMTANHEFPIFLLLPILFTLHVRKPRVTPILTRSPVGLFLSPPPVVTSRTHSFLRTRLWFFQQTHNLSHLSIHDRSITSSLSTVMNCFENSYPHISSKDPTDAGISWFRYCVFNCSESFWREAIRPWICPIKSGFVNI